MSSMCTEIKEGIEKYQKGRTDYEIQVDRFWKASDLLEMKKV